jgi:Putative beta-barrel porin-2, OmpL-like. bbp2
MNSLLLLHLLLTTRGVPSIEPESRDEGTLKYLTAVLLALSFPTNAAAQSPTSNASTESLPMIWTYGGFVDVGYLLDFNHPPNKLFRSRGTTWHTDHLHLNMFGAYAKKKPSEQERWGAELLVHAGKDDEVFGFSATAPNIGGSEWLRRFGSANVSYLAGIGRGLTLQGGIFQSLIGYDSLYAKDNFNYTRPWGADFTPYLMLGANASYPFSEDFTATFYIVNGYWHLAHANDVPSSGVQLAYRLTPAITLKETVLAGPHQSNTAIGFWRLLSDTIFERRSDRFVIAAECHFSTERVDVADPFRAWWMAAQIPLRWTSQSRWSVAVRPEIAWDSHGRWTAAEQTVKALTTTLDYRMSRGWTNTIVRLEHRVDDSRGPEGGFFAKNDSDPGVVVLTPRQHLLIVGLILTFDAPERR